MRELVPRPGMLPAWKKLSVPGTCAPSVDRMTRTLARLIPEGLRASLIRMLIVLPAIVAGSIGVGEGSPVTGVVEITNGGPVTGSVNEEVHMPATGQPHVWK